MTSDEKINNILINYIKSEKNRNIFIKHIKLQDDIQNTLYEVVIDLSKKIDLKSILSKIKNNQYAWKHNNFLNIQNEIKEHDNFILCPFEVDEGVLECNKCGSKKTFSYSKQTRSGDESTTVFATCVICKSSWKI
tara:strand:+ start:426 stop:830 length:405 start_codon:yes stop_codon:yes gene_type:complete